MSDWIQEYEGIFYAVNGKHIKIVPVGHGWYAFGEDIGDVGFPTYTKEDIIRMMDVLIKRLNEKKS